MNGVNFEVNSFASDVFMLKLGSLIYVTCRHCYVHTVRMESRSNMFLFNKPQFDSNLLDPYTSLRFWLSRSTRDRELTQRLVN